MKGQAATEFLIITAVALGVLVVLFGVVSRTNSINTSQFELNKARSFVDDITNAAELVFRQGVGSKTKIFVTVPENVNYFNFTPSLIQVNFQGADARDVYRSIDFTIEADNLATTAGNRVFYLESGTDFVYITDNVSKQAQLCGNNVKEGSENCDTNNYGGNACTTEGYDGGVIACDAVCVFDLSGCTGFGTPPNSITSLTNNSEGSNFVYWTWTNPTNADFSKNIVFVNGTNLVNTSNAYYNATGLDSNVAYTIIVHTMDSGGNVNDTDVTRTTTTQPIFKNTFVTVQTCAAEDNALKGTFLGSCDGSYPGVCGASNDLVSCNDGFAETHTANKVGGTRNYGGIKLTPFNSTILDCTTITKVDVCYEWWASGVTSDCSVSVDANLGTSYTAVTTTCPGTTANPGVTCVDVSSLEPWTCTSFFNPSASAALVKSEAQHNAGVEDVIITWDALYYNITYTIT